MSNETENNDDVKLFLALALWLGKKREMTVNQFLTWFTSYISTENKDYFKAIVPFFMEEQQRAENTLCSLLERDFLQKKKIRTVGSKITRQTDWSRTYAKAIPNIPIEYHGVEIQKQLDTLLLGALACIAGEWQMWLEKIVAWSPDDEWKKSDEIIAITKRVFSLKNAIGQVRKRGVVARSSLLSPKHRQIILEFVEPNDREAFLKSLNRWSQYSVKDLKTVMSKIERIIEKMLNDDANLDNLFEATSHLSILKAATDGDSGWSFVSDEISIPRKTLYHLKRGALNFELGKGNPGSLFENSKHIQNNKQADRMLQIRELGGHSGSGYEPDIVMGFYLDGYKHEVYVVFGDAKRYKKSDIAGAYKSTIASTMIAYGHWGKLEIKPNSCWEKAFCSPVKPFFTLFYVPDFGSKNTKKKDEGKDSPVRTFTLEQMKLKSNDGASDLVNWFKALYEQAESVLFLPK